MSTDTILILLDWTMFNQKSYPAGNHDVDFVTHFILFKKNLYLLIQSFFPFVLVWDVCISLYEYWCVLQFISYLMNNRISGIYVLRQQPNSKKDIKSQNTDSNNTYVYILSFCWWIVETHAEQQMLILSMLLISILLEVMQFLFFYFDLHLKFINDSWTPMNYNVL